tara:strand:- start:295 stop:486 length:192 start_codon:yes stop_codon:yes gene_type:complete
MSKNRIPHVELQVDYDEVAVMVAQDNSESNLRLLLATDQITLKDFFFRQGANQLNINTYKETL